jgi:hypothetical protein
VHWPCTLPPIKLKVTYVPVHSCFHQRKIKRFLTDIAYIIFVPIERHNVTDERKALEEVLIKFETELIRLNPSTVAEQNPVTNSNAKRDYTFLSGTNIPNLGDLSVYGVLRAIQHLPIYQKMIVNRGGPIMEWTQRTSHEIYGNTGTGRTEPNQMNIS